MDSATRHISIAVLVAWITVLAVSPVHANGYHPEEVIDKRGHDDEKEEHSLVRRTFLLPLGLSLGRAISGSPPRQQAQNSGPVVNIPAGGNPLDFPYFTGLSRNGDAGNYPYLQQALQGGGPALPKNPNGVKYPSNGANPFLPGQSFLNRPGANPFLNPSVGGQGNPFLNPANNPFLNPGNNPLINPGNNPFLNPGNNPFLNPGNNPFLNPTNNPFLNPTNNPFLNPSPNSPANPLIPSNPLNPLLITNPLNPLLPTNPLNPSLPSPPLNAANFLDPSSPLFPLVVQLLQAPVTTQPGQSNALGDVLSRLLNNLSGSLGNTLSDLLGNGQNTAPVNTGANPPVNPPVNPAVIPAVIPATNLPGTG